MRGMRTGEEELEEVLEQRPPHGQFGRRGGGSEAEALVVEGLREEVTLEEDLHVQNGVCGRDRRRLHPPQKVERLRACAQIVEQPQHAPLPILCVCVRACVRACVCVCARARLCVSLAG
jgi:hypothetical protein